jgi:multiple sugar transport system substrate-binding protein
MKAAAYPRPSRKGLGLAILLASMTSSLAFWGCQKDGKPAAEKSGKAEAAAEPSKDLKIWIMPNTPKPQEDMDSLLSAFRTSHPDLTVTVSVLDWSSAWTKITTASIAGDGPDLVQLGTTWVSSLTDLGALMPIDDLVKDVKASQIFLPNTAEAITPRASEHATSLPWFLDVRPMYYRSDVFAKAKVDIKSIQNWDDYLAALEAIKAAKVKHHGDIVAPVGFPGKNDWNVVHNFAPWIWGTGGDFLDPTGTKCTLNSPESMQGIKFFLGLVRKGLNPKTNLEKNTAQISSEFDAGRLATIFETTTKNIYLNLPPEQGGIGNSPVARNYGVAIPPTGPKNRTVFMGGSQLAIFRSTTNPAMAKELLKYLTVEKEQQLGYSKISGFLPALKTAFDDPYFTQDEKRSVFKELVQYGRVYPSVPYWGEIETSILTKRLGNLFDIAAEVAGPYSDEAVTKEVGDMVREVDAVIAQHFQNHPEHKAMLENHVAKASAE